MFSVLPGKNSVKKILHWCMPPICILCHQHADQPYDLCQPCMDDMPILPQTCPRCAKTFTTGSHPCGACLRKPPPQTAAYTLFAYQKPITKMLLDLKFQSGLLNARLFGTWLAHAVRHWYEGQPLPAVIIPMPLHARRLRERGFNQALEIARPLARLLQLPLDISSCQRRRATAAQAMLPAAQRRRNMKNAFTASDRLKGLHIAILDDVTTTGSTLTELARTCNKAGAARVDIWTCARALYADI